MAELVGSRERLAEVFEAHAQAAPPPCMPGALACPPWEQMLHNWDNGWSVVAQGDPPRVFAVVTRDGTIAWLVLCEPPRPDTSEAIDELMRFIHARWGRCVGAHVPDSEVQALFGEGFEATDRQVRWVGP